MSRWMVMVLAALGASGLATLAFGVPAGLWTGAALVGLGSGLLLRRQAPFPPATLRAIRDVAGRAGLVQADLLSSQAMRAAGRSLAERGGTAPPVRDPRNSELMFRGIRAGCRLAFAPLRTENGTRARLELSPRHPIPGHLVSEVRVAEQGFLPGGQPLGVALVSGELLGLCHAGDQLRLERGQLTFETDFDPARPPDVGALADALSEGLHALSQGERSVPARLARLVAEDPDPGVRGLALEALASEPALVPEAERALGWALVDREPTLRLRAASLLGGAAQDVLRELVADSAVDPDTRAGALTALSRGVAAGALADVARRCLDDAHPQLRAAAAEVLGRAQHPEASEALRARLEGAESRELCAVAQALARVGGPEVSVDLARALGRATLAEAPTLLAALAVLGDGRSTGAIRAFARRPGLAQDLTFAAQGALRAIQARGSAEEAGSLSLLEESDAGALSEAPEGGSGVLSGESDG